MQIGIFGGSFNPIHNGHLTLGQWFLTHSPIEKLFFIPAAAPPHKQVRGLVPVIHRKRMVELAINDNPDLAVSDVESGMETPNYTAETLNTFKRWYPEPEHRLFLIIGADSLIDLQYWKSPDEIIRLAHILVAPRPHINIDSIPAFIKHTVTMCQSPLIDISATTIREKIAAGDSIHGLVPPAVETYIDEHNLYIS